MRLLFDEQLSEELVTALQDLFPESLHVRLLGQGGAANPVVWQLALEHDCVLVTKRRGLSSLECPTWSAAQGGVAALGNCTPADIARLLRDRVDDIRRFEVQAEVTFLELG